jgi:hypothetical protein
MYKPGERPDDLAKAQTADDNVPSGEKQPVEVDDDGNPISHAQINSTNMTNATTVSQSNYSSDSNSSVEAPSNSSAQNVTKAAAQEPTS